MQPFEKSCVQQKTPKTQKFTIVAVGPGGSLVTLGRNTPDGTMVEVYRLGEGLEPVTTLEDYTAGTVVLR